MHAPNFVIDLFSGDKPGTDVSIMEAFVSKFQKKKRVPLSRSGPELVP
jgi:hypothetical protein